MATAQAASVYDSPTVLVVKIAASNPGQWRELPRMEKSRKVALTLTVNKSLRGDVPAGAAAKIEIEQRVATRRVHAVANPWASVDLSAGRKLVVFSGLSGSDAKAVLNAAALARDGEFEAEATAIVALAAMAKGKPSNWGTSISETNRLAMGAEAGTYLGDLLPELVKLGESEWSSVLRFIEQSGNPPKFRSQATFGAINALLLNTPAPGDLAAATVRSAFRLLNSNPEASVEQRLAQVSLPNLLGLQGAGPKLASGMVFAKFAGERTSAEAAVAKLADSPARSQLLAWFKQ